MGAVDLPLREIVTAMRTMVRAEAPELREELIMGVPMYVLHEPVLYIAAYTRHVNLGFRRGAQPKDARRLLEGTGKGLRHVKIRSPTEARTPGLRTLVRAAVDHARP